MQQIGLEHTGLQDFLWSSSKIAIAHKLGWDNMWMLDPNRKVIEILLDAGATQSFAVSAFRSSRVDFNTTDKLIAAGKSQDSETIISILWEISDFHSELLEEVLKSSEPKLRAGLIDYARHLFDEYSSSLSDFIPEECTKTSDYMAGVWEKSFSLLSVWEVIAAKVFTQYLNENWIPAVYIDTSVLQDISPHTLSPQVWSFIQNRLQEVFDTNPNAIPIIPGYIWGIHWGILAKLGRGYTDYTGERAAVALDNMQRFDEVLLYIQKLYGFKSTDPRALSNPEEARSVNRLSYDLVNRAISHKWAGAGLLNAFALSEDIRKKGIKIFVWNPTDSSDIAIINGHGNPDASGVELVLGRDYQAKHDHGIYGRKNEECKGNHIVYLMGDNIWNLWEIFRYSNSLLAQSNIQALAWELRSTVKPELSFVFRDKQEAIKAQRILHDAFIVSS